jgi:hypothetical protein
MCTQMLLKEIFPGIIEMGVRISSGVKWSYNNTIKIHNLMLHYDNRGFDQ